MIEIWSEVVRVAGVPCPSGSDFEATRQHVLLSRDINLLPYRSNSVALIYRLLKLGNVMEVLE